VFAKIYIKNNYYKACVRVLGCLEFHLAIAFISLISEENKE
jgi:hypothetical protein